MSTTGCSFHPLQPDGHSNETAPLYLRTTRATLQKLESMTMLSSRILRILALSWSDPFLKLSLCQLLHGVHGRLPCKELPGFERTNAMRSVTVLSSIMSSFIVTRFTGRRTLCPILPMVESSSVHASSKGFRAPDAGMHHAMTAGSACDGPAGGNAARSAKVRPDPLPRPSALASMASCRCFLEDLIHAATGTSAGRREPTMGAGIGPSGPSGALGLWSTRSPSMNSASRGASVGADLPVAPAA
eukprot:16452364-Heterocapsa_arctica.AAC.1